MLPLSGQVCRVATVAQALVECVWRGSDVMNKPILYVCNLMLTT